MRRQARTPRRFFYIRTRRKNTIMNTQDMNQMMRELMDGMSKEAVENTMMMKLVEKNMKPFDPTEGDDYKDIMKGVTKNRIGGE